MKRGLTVVLAVALAAVLLVPAAGAKPGKGNGHGPPAWAGGGGGGGGGGKPAWAGQQGGKADKAERKAEKAEWKAERKAAREGAAADGPKHMNPAWICKDERDQDAKAFIEKYGENENGANAFGKCVSRAAHDRAGVTEGEEGTPTSDDEETSDPGDSTDEEPEESALPASVQAFLHSLWPFFF